MRIALAQINPLVGDLPGNAARILAACQQSQQQGEPADLLLTPELSLWGYPPRDLLLNPRGVAQQQAVMDQLSQDQHDLAPALAGKQEHFWSKVGG